MCGAQKQNRTRFVLAWYTKILNDIWYI